MALKQQSCGVEIKIYDPSRTPRNWKDLMGPAQCAVLLKRAGTETPLTQDGKASRHGDSVVYIFDRLSDARSFCESRVQEYLYMCCEIFDSKGRANTPLLVVTHPDAAERNEYTELFARNQTILAGICLVGGVVLIVWDLHRRYTMIFPTYIGISMVFAGFRFLQWSLARKGHLREQQDRIAAHLLKEETRQAGAP